MPMAMSVHGLWLCRLSLASKITMSIVLLSYALRTKIIYIMLKINVLDSTKCSQRFTKEFVNTYLVLWRASRIYHYNGKTADFKDGDMGLGRLAVKIIFNNNNVQ